MYKALSQCMYNCLICSVLVKFSYFSIETKQNPIALLLIYKDLCWQILYSSLLNYLAEVVLFYLMFCFVCRTFVYPCTEASEKHSSHTCRYQMKADSLNFIASVIPVAKIALRYLNFALELIDQLNKSQWYIMLFCIEFICVYKFKQ